MDGIELLKTLTSLGSTGIVIYLVLVYNKDRAERDSQNQKERAERDKLFLDRLDRIEDRHLGEEKADREQVRDLFGQLRGLFDRVIAICNELSLAVKDLRTATQSNEATTKGLMDATKANEAAIIELRKELVGLRPAGEPKRTPRGGHPGGADV